MLVGVDLTAQGDETGVAFTLNFNPVEIGPPTNVSLGSGASGATLTTNLSDAAAGRIGILVDKPPSQPFAAGSRRLVTITFTVGPSAPTATTITFDGSLVANEVVNGSAATVPTTFTNGSISLLPPTAARVAISGRVSAADGSPIRNAQLTLRADDGTTRLVVTNSFGTYRIDSVEVGRMYVLTVSRKGYVFTQSSRAFVLTDDLTGVDFAAGP
jgi:hypothetical protein